MVNECAAALQHKVSPVAGNRLRNKHTSPGIENQKPSRRTDPSSLPRHQHRASKSAGTSSLCSVTYREDNCRVLLRHLLPVRCRDLLILLLLPRLGGRALLAFTAQLPGERNAGRRLL
ncbi:hypothetical protein BT93_G0405 [Corymbia citriodora subsp. variegata]|nr:hypothetical protein BT93_G0405 [Corymbia citriodora subsp. variegata]